MGTDEKLRSAEFSVSRNRSYFLRLIFLQLVAGRTVSSFSNILNKLSGCFNLGADFFSKSIATRRSWLRLLISFAAGTLKASECLRLTSHGPVSVVASND